MLVSRSDYESHYLGMRQSRVGVPVKADSNEESTFVLKIEKRDGFAVITNSEGMFLTARGKTVVLTDTLEEGSHWVIGNPLKTELDPNDGWFSLESANDHGRFLRHYRSGPTSDTL